MHAGNLVLPASWLSVSNSSQQPVDTSLSHVVVRRVLKGNQENASKILWNSASFIEQDMQDGLFSRKKKFQKAIIQSVTADWTYVRRGG